MKKKPLVIYRWNRSKDYVCWDDEVEIKHYIKCNVFDCKFKMGLLNDWITEIKSSF